MSRKKPRGSATKLSQNPNILQCRAVVLEREGAFAEAAGICCELIATIECSANIS
jgi:hypothetical protein